MSTPMRMLMSRVVGAAADLKLPTFLRAPAFKLYSRLTGASIEEARPPLTAYPSLGAFFVRRLVEGARPICPEGLPSPVDGTVQTICELTEGRVLQAKGRDYPVRELLGEVGQDLDLEGGFAWTIYLSPRDYHRIHSPAECRLTEASWMPGCRYSVRPKVLAKQPVLSINERTALRLETADGPLLLVLVGALNVGRIRVRGVDPEHQGRLERPLDFERGGELARFEMGSTIVLLAPPGRWRPVEGLEPGQPVKMGQQIAEGLPGVSP